MALIDSAPPGSLAISCLKQHWSPMPRQPPPTWWRRTQMRWEERERGEENNVGSGRGQGVWTEDKERRGRKDRKWKAGSNQRRENKVGARLLLLSPCICVTCISNYCHHVMPVMQYYLFKALSLLFPHPLQDVIRLKNWLHHTVLGSVS